MKRVYDQTHHVAPGYNAEVLLRWGDKLAADAPAFDAAAQTAEVPDTSSSVTTMISSAICHCRSDQTARIMACCASITNIPIRMSCSQASSTKDDEEMHKLLNEDQIAVNMACVGHSVVEIVKKDGKWSVVEDSALQPPHHGADRNGDRRTRGRS